MAAGASPIRAILWALAANLAIAVAKTGAALYTGSSSMMAEAIHSGADATNQVLLLIGLVRARRAPDSEHPLGYGKVAYVWSFIVALLLFTVGGCFSIYEGLRRLGDPGSLENAWVALLVLAVSIGLEGLSMRGCMVEVDKLRGDRSIWRWLRESRSSELIVIFGEDLAALLGLVVAFVFVLIAVATGNPIWDAWGSILIGGLLVLVAAFIAVLVKALLIGRSADPDVREALRAEIVGDPAITEVFNVITVQVGAQIMLAAKVRLREDLSIVEACQHINRLEAQLKERVPDLGWCFMEPDVVD